MRGQVVNWTGSVCRVVGRSRRCGRQLQVVLRAWGLFWGQRQLQVVAEAAGQCWRQWQLQALRRQGGSIGGSASCSWFPRLNMYFSAFLKHCCTLRRPIVSWTCMALPS